MHVQARRVRAVPHRIFPLYCHFCIYMVHRTPVCDDICCRHGITDSPLMRLFLNACFCQCGLDKIVAPVLLPLCELGPHWLRSRFVGSVFPFCFLLLLCCRWLTQATTFIGPLHVTLQPCHQYNQITHALLLSRGF